MQPQIDAILEFWFGELKDGFADESRGKLWFQSSDDTDRAIRERFGERVEQARRGELDDWANSARGRLALILLLDQFTRNIYRGSGDAFSGDSLARELTHGGIELGHDRQLAPAERVFFYLPFEHAEDLADQQRCVELYQELHDSVSEAYRKRCQGYVDYAIKHKEIIERYGRFPHRNKALGRESTAAEVEYLKEATTFGQ